MLNFEKKKFGHFDEKCVGGKADNSNNSKLQRFAPNFCLNRWVREGTQMDNLHFKMQFYPKKKFQICLVQKFSLKILPGYFVSCVDKIISLKDDFPPGYYNFL